MSLLSLIILALAVWGVSYLWTNRRKPREATRYKLVSGDLDVEFAEEPMPAIPEKHSAPAILDNGVEIAKDSVKPYDDVRIRYTGLLMKDGADGILVHNGRDGWEDAKDDWMIRQDDGSFEATVKVDARDELNFCFKDSADHYDDNNGYNWCVKVR